MVGFLHRDDEEESSNLSSSKLKNTVDPGWSDKFDFLDQFVPEVDDFSVPANVSFLDFDSIKDWLEEMQDPAFNAEVGVIETRFEPAPSHGGDVLVERLDGIDVQLAAVDDSGEGLRKESEGFENSPVDKGACFVKTEQLAAVDDSGEALENSPTEKGACFVKTEQLDGIDEQLVAVDDSGEGLFNLRVEKGGDGEEMVSLNTVVEEGLGKFSLVDEVELNPVDERSGCESESENSDSSASSSSSGEDDDGVDEGVNKEVSKEVKEDLEEGEIMETDEEDGDDDDVNDADIFNVFLMDDEDDDEGGGVKEPIMSKNELKVLPPVPPVDVTLQPSHQMLPVGFVSSILGAQVIVEGADKHNPLSEGSILWMTEKRSPLGRVDEIFGPVKNPYYIVRYNSESEVPERMHEGILVSFVPEFVDHVLNNKNLYQKGYDASGDNDEEVLDEAEFSDDEKEGEYRRMMKMSKRGNNTDMKPGGNKKSNKSFKRNDVQSRNYHQSNSMQDSPQAGNMQNQQVEYPVRHPTDCSNQPCSSRFSPAYNSGPGMIPGLPQPGQPSGFTSNWPRPNGMPFQMQNGEFANGFQMPWIQQHQQFQQLPMMNSGPPFQQAFNPAGPSQNNMVPSYSPLPAGSMVPNVMNQVPFSMALQAQLAQLSMLSGVLSSGLLTGQGGAGGNNMQHLPANLQQNAGGNNLQQNAEAPTPPQFNNGAGSGLGPSRPGGRPFQRRGGRSGGRGGRRGIGRGHSFQAR